ncbi:MAG: hypothetical protein ACKO6Q_08360 [Bacteroidota bacterium]
MQLVRFLLAASILLNSLSGIGQTQEDVLLITEARIALKNRDYKTAVASLEQVSQSGRSSTLYLQYAAEAYEGTGDLEMSLALYETLITKTPLTPELAEKIATIRYKIRQKKVANKEQQDELERQKMAAYKNISGSYYGASFGFGQEPGVFKYDVSKSSYKIVYGYDLRIYNGADQLIFQGSMNANSFQEEIKGTYTYHLDPYDDRACYLNSSSQTVEDESATLVVKWNEKRKILALSLRHRYGRCNASGFRKPVYEFYTGQTYLDLVKSY